MATETRHPPDALTREAASLFHLLGGMGSKHLVIVGGLVPPLLVPGADEPHQGSADIDLCLSVAITKGATSEYYKSIEELINPYFESVDAARFRWRKKEGVGGLPLLVDFMAPETEETPVADGTVDIDDETAAANVGVRLSPWPLRAGALVDADAMDVVLEGVELVYRPGTRADVTIRHAGPVGFLAAKADALEGRDDPKDGYDISWWCLNADSNAAAVAEQVLERPTFKDPFFQESVTLLEKGFRAPDYVGPTGYAEEKHPNLAPGDEVYEQARNEAFAAVSELVQILKSNLWA